MNCVMRRVAFSAPVYDTPDVDGEQVTAALFGEVVQILEDRDPFVLVKTVEDGYQGYLEYRAVKDNRLPKPTHTVLAPRTIVRPAPDIKVQGHKMLGLNARVRVEEMQGAFARLWQSGWVPLVDLRPINAIVRNWVGVLERLVETPYIWGERDPLKGLDCSAVVHHGGLLRGERWPRDTKDQMYKIGRPRGVRFGIRDLRRGDLVYWKGHVAVALGRHQFLHANARDVHVVVEPVDAVLEHYGKPLAIRRP